MEPLDRLRAICLALPVASWYTANNPGTPCPSGKISRTRWPGALGAIIVTSTFSGGTIWL